jgi:hypothetical protein
MGAAVAVMVRREKELVEVFLRAGAVSTARAKTLGDLQVEDDHTFARLKDRAILREGAPGFWYVDEQGWNARGRMRRRFSIVIVTLAAIVIVGILLTGRTVWSP